MTRSPGLTAALVALLATPALAPAPGAAQELFDRGVFVITRSGAEVGREEFALRAATGRAAPGLPAGRHHAGRRGVARVSAPLSGIFRISCGRSFRASSLGIVSARLRISCSRDDAFSAF